MTVCDWLALAQIVVELVDQVLAGNSNNQDARSNERDRDQAANGRAAACEGSSRAGDAGQAASARSV